MKIPEPVKQAAQGLIDIYGLNIDYLGTYEGAEYYMFVFPEGMKTGYPEVYQYENGEVLTLTGMAALYAIDLFIKE